MAIEYIDALLGGNTNSHDSGLLIRNHGAQRKWHIIFQGMREKNSQLWSLNQVKLSFRNKGKTKTFSCKGELKIVVPEDLPLRIIKCSSSNRREKLKEAKLEHQEGGRNRGKNRNMGMQTKLYFSSWAFKLIFDE